MKPEILFKYTSPSTAEIILNSCRLRWSSPTLFNDIGEFNIRPSFDPSIFDSQRNLIRFIYESQQGKNNIDLERIIAPTKIIYDRVLSLVTEDRSLEFLIDEYSKLVNPNTDEEIAESVIEILNEQISSKRILSLTSSNDNVAMWGIYAENNKGCVFGFKSSDSDSPFQLAEQINYTDSSPSVGSGMDFILYGGNFNELTKKTIKTVCFTKRTVWQYEQEWRLMTNRSSEGKNFGDYIFLGSELDSVTLGANASNEFTDKISLIVRDKYPHTHLFRMVFSKGKLLREKF